MVFRKDKRARKYLGTRRWGVGNIKNARGAGGRGGVGRAGARKHKFTRMVTKERELMKRHGFVPWNRKRLDEINLRQIDIMTKGHSGEKPTIELNNYKVLSNGNITRPIIIKANKFSKTAIEKIKNAGGEAIVIK
jgi:large subunit ribosomal protein L15